MGSKWPSGRCGTDGRQRTPSTGFNPRSEPD
jgi:hypothetical protein